MKYIYALATALTLTNFSPAFAFELEIEKNGVRYYTAGESLCGSALNVVSNSVLGSFNGLKEVKALPPPPTQSFAVDRGAELKIEVEGIFKIEAKQAAATDLQVIVHSADGITEVGQAVEASNEAGVLSFSRVAASRSRFALPFLKKDKTCVLASKNGKVISVKGTCPVLQLSLGNDERIKVYRDGRYLARSRSATLNFDDVASVFTDSSDAGAKLLKEYLEQSGLKSTDEMLTYIQLGQDPYAKVKIVEVMAPFAPAIDVNALKSLLAIITDDYRKLDAVKALRDRLNISEADLPVVVRLVDDIHRQEDIIKLLRPKSALDGDAGASHIAPTISAINDDHQKIKVLKNLLKTVGVVTVADLRAIVSDIENGHQQVEAVEAVAPKLSIVGADLAGLIGLLDRDDHLRFDAAKKVLSRIEAFTADDVSAALGKIRDKYVRLDLLKALNKKVLPEERPGLNAVVERHFSNYELEDARKVMRR